MTKILWHRALLRKTLSRNQERKNPKRISNWEKLNERVQKVEKLPIKQAEKALGVKGYFGVKHESGYLSHLLHEEVKLGERKESS